MFRTIGESNYVSDLTAYVDLRAFEPDHRIDPCSNCSTLNSSIVELLDFIRML